MESSFESQEQDQTFLEGNPNSQNNDSFDVNIDQLVEDNMAKEEEEKLQEVTRRVENMTKQNSFNEKKREQVIMKKPRSK